MVTTFSHCSQSTSVPFCLTLTKMCLQLLPPLDKHHSAQLELLGIRELAVTQAVSGQCHQKTSARTHLQASMSLSILLSSTVVHITGVSPMPLSISRLAGR